MDFSQMTREELIVLLNANIAERARLVEENALLGVLYNKAISTNKVGTTEYKIAKLQALLTELTKLY
jgi:hypothetical protein